MMILIKHSLTPQQIKDKIMDPSLDFQKRIVEYLESVHIGEFIDQTMEQLNATYKDISSNHIKPTLTIPQPVLAKCDKICTEALVSNMLCDLCKAELKWWKMFIETVNEIAYWSNTHKCRIGCCNNKYKTCKAQFPLEVQNKTKMNPETNALTLKKKEAWLNCYTLILTYLFRCNTNVTSLLSGTAIKCVIAYITDYITKSPLKTHTMFDAVKTVFRRHSEILAENDTRQEKARKITVKIVNSLTAQSEIEGLMACMYLLKHSDHYTSHKFQCFYWRGYVNEVARTWNFGKDENRDAEDHLKKS